MTDLTPEELRTAWKNEERRAQIKGWDFSHIEGRYIEEPLPWTFSSRKNRKGNKSPLFCGPDHRTQPLQ